jgi:hypothetical protein
MERLATHVSVELLTVRQSADPHQLPERVGDDTEADSDRGVGVPKIDVHRAPPSAGVEEIAIVVGFAAAIRV